MRLDVCLHDQVFYVNRHIFSTSPVLPIACSATHSLSHLRSCFQSALYVSGSNQYGYATTITTATATTVTITITIVTATDTHTGTDTDIDITIDVHIVTGYEVDGCSYCRVLQISKALLFTTCQSIHSTKSRSLHVVPFLLLHFCIGLVFRNEHTWTSGTSF